MTGPLDGRLPGPVRQAMARLEQAGYRAYVVGGALRRDGRYRDGRRPVEVQAAATIEEDLARRDFTINAMAYGEGKLIDPFGGQQDLARRQIRTVGRPEERFQEDALRILRALRFAAVLGFSIEAETAAALRNPGGFS